jgi:hypothetical protein
MPIIDPENRVGLPSPDSHNIFSNLCLADFDIISSELASWEKFSKGIFKYGFTKTLLQGKKIVVPGVKTFFSIPIQETEQSIFNSVAGLDETADKKDTVLKVLNILYEKFQVGVICDQVVVVGDGKSYDIVIKLKAEYGTALNWVLPYPGDWHILKNMLPIFIKLYFDAGLKQLTTKFHHGSTLRILTDCSKFVSLIRFGWKVGKQY